MALGTPGLGKGLFDGEFEGDAEGASEGDGLASGGQWEKGEQEEEG